MLMKYGTFYNLEFDGMVYTSVAEFGCPVDSFGAAVGAIWRAIVTSEMEISG